MQPCIVLIPIYQKQLPDLEKQALDCCLEKLPNIPKMFIAPYDIEETYYGINYPELQIRKYTQWHHDRIDDYNQLMLNDEFYAGFTDYEFVFIFQTDGWFLGREEDLNHFCQLSIDYIGAPWGDNGFRFCKRIIPGAGKCKLLYLLEQSVTCYVGNGGVSLRRNSQMINLLREKKKELAKNEKAEDLFISYYAQKSKCNFRVASKELAETFALEMNMKEKIRAGMIPMAIHKWKKYYPEFREELS